VVGLDVAARRAQEEPRAVRVSFLRDGRQRHGAEPCPKRFIVNCERRTSRIRVTVHGNAPFGCKSHSNVSLALLHSPIRQELKLCVTSGRYFSRASYVARSFVPNILVEQGVLDLPADAPTSRFPLPRAHRRMPGFRHGDIQG
jgi:hypothetical protein